MGDTDIYKRQNLGQPISIGRSPALLIVDFVNGFLDPEMFGGGNVLEAAHNTQPVLELFRKAKLPVVFTRIVYAEDESDCGVWCEKAPRLKELTEASISSHVADFLAPQVGEIVIKKTQASAFFDTALASILKYRQVDTLVFAGATTSGCVRASVVDATSLNFRPLVLSDCVGDRALGPHDANLFDMGQKYANIAVSSELESIFPTFK
ncbi:isochorismatase family protein [Aliiroseovarius sp. S1339]|uniref:isochorismatase family protein n=1 Tax=Aliiroseovarius sp. S1339 TaxID=2936990 RepID=UPI0020BDF17E|nr:isochorismatase family protein [Aliiroseovarius sp. S1339]MCK8463743.1 isochorismatase family protein [Aliiroseovarius sp. S1339]